LDTFISVNTDGHYMGILKKDFGYGREQLKSYSAQPLRLGGMVAGRISFPPAADWEKQGKTGLNAGAPREVSDSCLCKRGKPADKPVSPLSFPNEIRTAIYHVF
jgi:hypothetical protein